jgi:hypothetical protein
MNNIVDDESGMNHEVENATSNSFISTDDNSQRVTGNVNKQSCNMNIMYY